MSFSNPEVSFGDRVRIRSTTLTQKLGFADLLGTVHGQTTPSVTGIDVIGQSDEDYAVHVFFEERNEGFWFVPGLIEFVDHAPGSEITLKGVPKKWVRSASGEWKEFGNASQSRSKRPWWRFW
jgi:hypothetical protein